MNLLLLTLGVLGPIALLAARRDTRLDRLFERLRSSPNMTAARAVSDQIWDVWMQHDDPEVRALMNRGVRAMSNDRYEDAAPCFDAIIERDPDYAEGWNKRATIRYLQGNYAGAVRDIKHTLSLEPRHFGALAGLGAIYLLIANDRGALDAFQAILALNPHLESVRRQVDALRDELDDEDK